MDGSTQKNGNLHTEVAHVNSGVTARMTTLSSGACFLNLVCRCVINFNSSFYFMNY